MPTTLTKFFKEEDGQGMAEYGLILALVALVVITALSLMGEGLRDFFAEVTGELDEAVN